MTFAGVVDEGSLVVTALGLVVGALLLARTRTLVPAVAVLMEMLTGAGLLRLAASPTWTRAAGAGGVLLVRRIVILGLRADNPPAPGPAGPASRHLLRSSNRQPWLRPRR